MPQIALRFGVRENDRRGATWKLWTEAGAGKSELYLASRGLGGALKTSLHESGKWHVAFSQQAFESRIEGVVPSLADRFIEKWERPPEIHPGTTLAYRIVTPSASVTSPLLAHSALKKVIWLPNAPYGEATEIDILIIEKVGTIRGWPGQRSLGTSLVGSFQLENGSTVFAVYHTIQMPDLSGLSQGRGRLLKGVSRERLREGHIRAVAFRSEPDGSRTIFDFAVLPKPDTK